MWRSTSLPSCSGVASRISARSPRDSSYSKTPMSSSPATGCSTCVTQSGRDDDRLMSEPQLLLSGLGIAESVRWHEGRAWVANWGSGEVLAVDANGDRETVAQLSTNPLPLSFDWLPDGRLLIVD